MKRKPQKEVLTPYMDQAMQAVTAEGVLTLAAIQRHLKCSFHKAIEIALLLSERGLVKSNVKELKIELP